MRCRVLMASSSRGTTLSDSEATTFTSAGRPTRASLSASPSTSPRSPSNTWADTPHLYKWHTQIYLFFQISYATFVPLFNKYMAKLSHTALYQMLSWYKSNELNTTWTMVNYIKFICLVSCITRCSRWPCYTSRREDLLGPHCCPQTQTAAPVICPDLKHTHKY